MRKKLEPEEKPVFGVTTVYRERGNYLQRLEQFEKAISSYNEALRWNDSEVRSLLGRSLARAKATYYAEALEDAARATELEPNNMTAMQIRTQTEYEKCAFERALVLAHRGQRIRRYPHNFAECARHAEETIRDCVSKCASKVLLSAIPLLKRIDLKRDSIDPNAPAVVTRQSRMVQQPTHQVQELSRVEKTKANQIARLMTRKYLGNMFYDKYFLKDLCKDERLMSANKEGSRQLKELAHSAFADVIKRQEILRERRPLYAAQSAERAAKERLNKARKERLEQTRKQHEADALRLVKTAEAVHEERDTAKCIEVTQFAMEQIARKPANLLPGKEKFLQQLYDIIANAFLDQKRVGSLMNESDREKRAFVLLGMILSREPSQDSVLRVRPPAPPRDVKERLRKLERALSMSARAVERCYVLHELARLHLDIKQPHRARFYAIKCQADSRTNNQRVWLLNATFLLARCHILHNNRPEARAALLEGATLAKSFRWIDVSEFFETCANVSTEGEVASDEATVEKREKAMVDLMQDDDLRSAAEHLFRKMSAVPAARRFSVMPGAKVENTAELKKGNRRVSIMPKAPQPVFVGHKSQRVIGFQDFDA